MKKTFARQEKLAIQMDGISVQYRLMDEKVTSFKDFILRSIKGRNKFRYLWALRDITFQVKKGESVGFIGANGAGKSTLLKVIARILRPAQGDIRVHGLVAPILELGTVFDPELTGRENIYLNGAMLGYSRRIMDKKIQSLMDFSEVGDFFDTPLRNYSDGMVARLAFAIATDVDADILLIDEILSVGDNNFQKKCVDRMTSFKEKGKTLIIVSHDLGLIEKLCTRTIWLEYGRIREDGEPAKVIASYKKETAHSIVDKAQVEFEKSQSRN